MLPGREQERQHLGEEHAVAEAEDGHATRLQDSVDLRKHLFRLLQVLHAARTGMPEGHACTCRARFDAGALHSDRQLALQKV